VLFGRLEMLRAAVCQKEQTRPALLELIPPAPVDLTEIRRAQGANPRRGFKYDINEYLAKQGGRVPVHEWQYVPPKFTSNRNFGGHGCNPCSSAFFPVPGCLGILCSCIKRAKGTGPHSPHFVTGDLLDPRDKLLYSDDFQGLMSFICSATDV